jgi:hypothetical protein
LQRRRSIGASGELRYDSGEFARLTSEGEQRQIGTSAETHAAPQLGESQRQVGQLRAAIGEPLLGGARFFVDGHPPTENEYRRNGDTAEAQRALVALGESGDRIAQWL